VLWEEKSATDALDPDAWVEKHVVGKFDSYLEARQYLPGYQDAPIGFDFTGSNVDPPFKAKIEQAIENLQTAHPDVPIQDRWAP
jgi:hypothetical protein